MKIPEVLTRDPATIGPAATQFERDSDLRTWKIQVGAWLDSLQFNNVRPLFGMIVAGKLVNGKRLTFEFSVMSLPNGILRHISVTYGNQRITLDEMLTLLEVKSDDRPRNQESPT